MSFLPGSGGGIQIAQAAHGFAVGDVIYLNGSTYTKAQANDPDTANVVGIVSQITDVNNFVYLQSGTLTLAGLTSGDQYYLSEATLGAYTNDQPDTGVIKPLFVAISATSALINLTNDANGIKQNNAITADPAAAEINNVYSLDASGAAFDFTLPAATGSQGVIEILGKDVATNAVTVKVQTGEFLQGTLNGTYTVDGDGERIQFTDRDTGYWDVAVLGLGQNLLLEKAYIKEISATVNTSLQQITGSSNSDWDAVAGTGQRVDLSGATSDIIGSTTVGATAITIGKDGRYSVDASVTLEIDANKAFVQLVKNGTDVLAVASEQSGANAPANFAIVWEGDLLNTDTLDLRVDSNAANNNQVLAYHVNVSEVPATEAVLAGMVVPETLHRAFLRRNYNTTGQQSINTNNLTYAGSTVLDLDLGTEITDVGNLYTAGVDAITIQQAGTYRIEFIGDPNDGGGSATRSALSIGVNGAEVSNSQQSHNSGFAQLGTVTYVAALSASDVIDFRVGTDGGESVGMAGFSISVEQLPDSTVVDPDALVPETLAYAKISQSNTPSLGSGTSQLTYNTVEFDNIGGVADTANNQLIIPTDGRYVITVNADIVNATSNESYQVTILADGSQLARSKYSTSIQQNGSGFNARTAPEFLTAGTLITVNYFATGGSAEAVQNGAAVNWLALEQLPTYSVVAPDATVITTDTVNKTQTIDGWRRESGTGTVGTPVVFSSAFSVAPSVVVSNTGGSSDRTISTSSPTTTGFTPFSWNIGSNSASTGEAFTWIAEGQA